jgi:hypothetical protein
VNVLQFSVTRQHVSVADAAAYVLTAFGAFPSGGTAQIICGASGESLIACTFNAVLQEMPKCTFRGTRSDTTFVLRGGLITTSAPLTANGVDAGAFGEVYAYPQGGTIDGGNLADALMPVAMNLEGDGYQKHYVSKNTNSARDGGATRVGHPGCRGTAFHDGQQTAFRR